jgi:hypothetical protein
MQLSAQSSTDLARFNPVIILDWYRRYFNAVVCYLLVLNVLARAVCVLSASITSPKYLAYSR